MNHEFMMTYRREQGEIEEAGEEASEPGDAFPEEPAAEDRRREVEGMQAGKSQQAGNVTCFLSSLSVVLCATCIYNSHRG